MPPTSTAVTPEWLERSHYAEHITTMLQVLTNRERTREGARMASRNQANPSKTHRLIHLPTTIFKNSNDVNHYSISIACTPENRKSNRYADIEPYDRTRVVVGHGGTEPSGRYLNASWVRELAGGKWWIATQAPLPDTVHAFLSVLLQPMSCPPYHLHPMPSSESKTSRVRTIVQLTQNVESGMRKAHVYFPPIEGQSWIVPPEEGCKAPSIEVTLLEVDEVAEAHCVISTVSIQPLSSSGKLDGELVMFKHMLYASWPDHGVPDPEHRDTLLHFAYLVDRTNRGVISQPPAARAELDPDPPIMVNCSAGVGRTGAFIALCSLLRKSGFLEPFSSTIHGSKSGFPSLPPSPLGPLPDELKDDLVAQDIDSLREQRPGMVQRPDQVLLIYEVLITAFLNNTEKGASQR